MSYYDDLIFSRSSNCYYTFNYPNITKKVSMIARYHVINGNTHKIENSFNYEGEAITNAEKLAQSNLGVDYVVMQSITKSRCDKPVITTRF